MSSFSIEFCLPSFYKEKRVGEKMVLVDVMVKIGFANSKSEARRLIEQRAVKVNHKVETDPKRELEIPEYGMALKVGKRRFAKLVI